jgi:hypothetical protein
MWLGVRAVGFGVCEEVKAQHVEGFFKTLDLAWNTRGLVGVRRVRSWVQGEGAPWRAVSTGVEGPG